MSAEAEALSPGTILSERFEVHCTLGRGGFGIVYLAQDLDRRDSCVVKELAPTGFIREESGLLRLPHESTGESQKLRQRFLDEAKIISKLNVPGVLPVRAFFHENGTAYFVSDYLEDASTLDHMIKQEGRLDGEGALDILFQIIEILDAVHAAGILHRDIKPSNILIDRKGRAHLIDFGAAREWHADSTTHHTILYTPGYAPMEQLSERARRGPATDIYALCATAYHMLSGECPPSATDRAAGLPLPHVIRLRPDLESSVAEAIMQGLELNMADRPQSIQDLRLLIGKPSDPKTGRSKMADFDRRAYELQHFSCRPKQCPSCGHILAAPKPLKRMACPVCQKGTIRMHKLSDRLCPSCRAGVLHQKRNVWPLLCCPVCNEGILESHKKKLLGKEYIHTCLSCEAVLEGTETEVKLISTGKRKTTLTIGTTMPADQWRTANKRSEIVNVCDGCHAQYDLIYDGRWLEAYTPKKRTRESYYAEEWARIAAGLSPGSGNAFCDTCEADYYIDGEKVTLQGAHRDAFGFADRYMGRLLTIEDLRWLGVGKTSPNPGIACTSCLTEFDTGPTGLILVSSPSPVLAKLEGKEMAHADWCRAAKDLPTQQQEDSFYLSFDESILDAYESGDIHFDSKGKDGIAWKSNADRFRLEGEDWIEDGTGVLTIRAQDFVFGGLIRKTITPLSEVVGAWSDEGHLMLKMRNGLTWAFKVPFVELSISLKSGRRQVQLGAESLARRIEAQILG